MNHGQRTTPGASLSAFRVEATAAVFVDVRNPDVIERVTGPNGDEWRGQFYRSIKTAEDVVAHFAYNALANGVTDVSRLEGWGDVDDDDVEIVVDAIETSAEPWS